MATGRLTRQELRWLLAQEARGAADSLRQDVTFLTQPPPKLEAAAPKLEPKLESSLNALDDAIDLLAELEVGQSRPRRGRIDLAALLCELSPSARIALEPGAGTEVFGEESELRRLLHVLVSLSNPAGPQAVGASEVQIRREGEWVRISVSLGPDISASLDLERRWLSRMATRLGGRLELEGGMVCVLVPADASGDQGEVADLRKELEQAQQLGETYARELAAIFESADHVSGPPEPESSETAARNFALLVAMCAGLASVVRPLVERLQEDADLARKAVGESSELAEHLGRRLVVTTELAGELTRIAQCPADEARAPTDLAAAVREVAQFGQRRSNRHEVAVTVEVEGPVVAPTRPKTFALLLRCLLDHAIAATPRGGQVCVRLAHAEGGMTVRFADGGPVVPASSAHDLLEGRLDPASLGRPGGIALIAARAAAARLGAAVAFGHARTGATELVVRLPAA